MGLQCANDAHTLSLPNLQNALHDLAMVKIRVRVCVGVKSEICKLCMLNFEIAQRILQIVQVDKLHTDLIRALSTTYSGAFTWSFKIHRVKNVTKYIFNKLTKSSQQMLPPNQHFHSIDSKQIHLHTVQICFAH